MWEQVEVQPLDYEQQQVVKDAKEVNEEVHHELILDHMDLILVEVRLGIFRMAFSQLSFFLGQIVKIYLHVCAKNVLVKQVRKTFKFTWQDLVASLLLTKRKVKRKSFALLNFGFECFRLDQEQKVVGQWGVT